MSFRKTVEFKSKDGAEREKRSEKLIQTGRYDRNAIKQRIDVEEWLDGEIKTLYDLSDNDNNNDVEIDVDEVLDQDGDDAKETLILNLCRGVPKANAAKVKPFAQALIEKIGNLKRLK